MTAPSPSEAPDHSTTEVASLVGLTPETINRLVGRGKIRGFRINPRGRWRIPHAEFERLQALVTNGRQAAVSP